MVFDIMSKIFPKLIFPLLVSSFVYCCGNMDKGHSDLLLTSDNDGQMVTINLDDEIIIELKSNPSTGYRWVHANAEESAIYQVGESTFTENPACSGLPGCGGLERLTFRASRVGSDVIKLVYCRSFEQQPADYFSVHINVR